MAQLGVCVWAIAGLLIGSTGRSAAEPLQPVKPWVVHYEPATCSAERNYGKENDPVTLAFEPSAWGNSYDLLIATNGDGPRHAEELKGSVDFGEGPIDAWLLHYGIDKPAKLTFFRFRISAEQMAQAKKARLATFRLGRTGDLRFSLAQIPELLTTLAACTADLQHYWDMVDPEQKNIAAPAVGDIAHAFDSRDYPDEALVRDQGGTAQFLLLVNEQGRVAECSVLKPSGIPALDGMGCQVIQQRVQFKPAIGRNGKPMRSVFTTPPITWRMAN